MFSLDFGTRDYLILCFNSIMWSIYKETGPAVDSNREKSSEGEESDDNEEQCRIGDILDTESKPNQPHPKLICVQILPNKVLHFQEDLYRRLSMASL